MKKVYTVFFAVLITAIGFSQAPQKMSYQAVIRNTSNELVKNSPIGMKISILQGSATGTPVYVETQTPTSNANGLVTIEIGGVTPVTGTFAGIDWSTGTYFIKTETDPTGGTSYTITGTSQLLSVPYALFAKTTESSEECENLKDFVYSKYPPSTTGLVAYYSFNGNANDESGNGLNGVVNGAILTTDRRGNTNTAFSFSDNQDITIPNSQNQNLYPISISFWYSVTSISGDYNGSGSVFSKYTVGSWNGYQINVGDYSNVPNAGGLEHNGYGTTSWYVRSANDRIIGYYGESPFLQQNISLNTWYHYVFIADETGGKIYANGKLIDSHAWTGTPGACNNSNIWKIGGLYNSTWFKGKIDDIRIYNRTLTYNEIQQLYHEGGL